MATSRFIRFFSRRHNKIPTTGISDKNQILSNTKSQTQQTKKQGLICTIILLDGENVNIEVDRKALGKVLYDKVLAYTKLIESDYFALQFIDTHNVKQWLDPTKSIKQQCKFGPPYSFRFRVKFYASDPKNLHDELTRYLFVLQLKDDIRTGKLDCPDDCAIELAALAMQAELGDYNSHEHSIETISEYHLLPSDRQTEEFEEQVVNYWITQKGLTPADCEVQYLNRARWLEMYGVDLHTVTGKDGLEYRLGLTPTGILVFENDIKIGLFVWPKVTRIDFHRNKLTIVVLEDDDHDPKLQRDFVFLFRCYDEKQCKHFWKCAMEYHIFYRTTSTSKVKQCTKSNLTRMGSRFRFSGRTECETTVLTKLARQGTTFERKASQRFSRRASYAIRKKIQEQELHREQEEERIRKLKAEQEAKLDEQKRTIEPKNQTNSSKSNHDSTINGKLSSSQKALSLSAAQRLDFLIQGTPSESHPSKTETNMPSADASISPPPVPPRTNKTDEKTMPSSITVKREPSPPTSHIMNGTTISNGTVNHEHSDDQVKNGEKREQLMSIENHSSTIANGHSLTNGHSQPSSLENKTINSRQRYSLAPGMTQNPLVVKETAFYSEKVAQRQSTRNMPNFSCPISSPNATFIVTRTLSTSNVKQSCSPVVQTGNGGSPMAYSLSSGQLTRIPLSNSSTIIQRTSCNAYPSYRHPLTTEL